MKFAEHKSRQDYWSILRAAPTYQKSGSVVTSFRHWTLPPIKCMLLWFWENLLILYVSIVLVERWIFLNFYFLTNRSLKTYNVSLTRDASFRRSWTSSRIYYVILSWISTRNPTSAFKINLWWGLVVNQGNQSRVYLAAYILRCL